MISNIRHSGIVVDCLDSSLKFYKDLLGFEAVKSMDESGSYIDEMLGLNFVDVKTVKMTCPDGQMIELLDFKSHKRERKKKEICDVGITHIALSVNNLDQCYQTLKSENIEFISPPQLTPDGFAKVAFCKAPEGTYVELVQEL